MFSNMVVSLTTTPRRIHNIHTTIESLLSQTLLPKEIILNIPIIFEKTGETYTIPPGLTDKITIHYCDTDYGPGTKIIPTIEYLRKKGYDEPTRIVYVDDDIQYPPNMLKKLAETNPAEVHAASGFIFKDLKIYGIRESGATCDIVEGYGGVCVMLNMFKPDFEEYISSCIANKSLKFSDDVYLSNYYAKHGHIRRIYGDDSNYSFRVLWDNGCILEHGQDEDALHNGMDNTIPTNQLRYINSIEWLSMRNMRYFNIYIQSKYAINGKVRLVPI